MRKLRWGLLSTARINDALIPPIRASPRNELYGVASRSQELALAYARERDIPQAYGSYEEMLADPEIDVIYNPLPNSMHAEWTIKAAQAGKHILCEKPLAMTVEEVDAMTEAARTAGVALAEAFMYRHHPQTKLVKQLVQQGEIGDLWLGRGSFTFYLNRTGDVRVDPALGGGSIWDVGCYPVSYLRYITGREPSEVFGWQVVGETGVDMAFQGQLRFGEQIYGQFDCGFRAPLRAFIEVVGTHGTIQVPNPFKPGMEERILLTKNGEVTAIEVDGINLYAGEVENMADVILNGADPTVSLEDSRGNVAALNALLRSAITGKPELLP